MRTKRVVLGAVGVTVLPLDPHKIAMNYQYQLFGDQAVNLTCQVDSTMSKLDNYAGCTVARSGTTVTVTFAADHGLSATTDYVTIKDSGTASIDGTYLVTAVTNPTVITYTSGTSGTVSTTSAKATPLKFNQVIVATGAGSTTVNTGTKTIPLTALILNVTAYTAGKEYLEVLQQGLT